MIRTALSFALLTAPAFAQAPDCAGIGVAGSWIGGDIATSDIASAETSFDAEVQTPLIGHLVHLFSLSETADIRIEANPLDGGDPTIALIDASGREVAANDDFGGGFGSRIETTLEPGAYCVTTRDHGGAITPVALRVGRIEHPALGAAAPVSNANSGPGACTLDDLPTLADGPLDAAMLAATVQAVGTVTEFPAWQFELAEAAPLTITATMENGDPLIRLRDGAGNLLEENDDADGLNARINVESDLPVGRYCLELEDVGGDDAPVTVSVTTFDPVAERRRGLDAAEFAPTAADEVTIAELGVVQTSLLHDVSGDVDEAKWVRFEMPEDGLMVIEAVGQNVDPRLVLFDALGRPLGENDDGPDGLDSLLAIRLRAGAHLMAVALVNSEGNGNVRLIFERFVPAR
ncbi:MAG: hypothetical protein AAF919_03705 [Pseudomonadota bacterium]